jgi:transposase-like protein
MGKKDHERRVYPKEFKAEAVALAEKHQKPVCQVASDLGINETLLYRWIQQARGPVCQPSPGTDDPRTRN